MDVMNILVFVPFAVVGELVVAANVERKIKTTTLEISQRRGSRPPQTLSGLSAQNAMTIHPTIGGVFG